MRCEARPQALERSQQDRHAAKRGVLLGNARAEARAASRGRNDGDDAAHGGGAAATSGASAARMRAGMSTGVLVARSTHTCTKRPLAAGAS